MVRCMAEAEQPKRRTYQRTGFYTLKNALASGSLDGRSRESRAIARWKAEVESDLGGNLSTAQRTLLEAASGDMALLLLADGFIASTTGILNRRKRCFAPIVADRLRVAASLKDTLKTLGLERKAKAVPLPWEPGFEWPKDETGEETAPEGPEVPARAT